MGNTIKSYAKINLQLFVGKVVNGYHNLYTLMQLISLYDLIEIRKNNKPKLYVEYDDKFNFSNALNDKNHNIAFLALELFCKQLKIKNNHTLYIKKNIPIGAGLGGGSSNAAIVLLYCNRIYGYPFTLTELLNIASEIGSDVPFFIYQKMCLCKNRGEQIIPIDIQGLRLYGVAIFTPPSISTAEVYQKYEHNDINNNFDIDVIKQIDLMLKMFLNNVHIENYANLFINNLTDTILKIRPDLDIVFQFAIKYNIKVSFFSGSGPTVICLTESKDEALNIYNIAINEFKYVYNINTLY